ncbi:YggT family protein [Fundicoccus culcitae]|uniref:YggT family protein n=1 Tax=Fundicoccus culcitae TaxID=2969821 RepID=A0ABY5P6A2_9LACT|nr:YggT family protein [Fundicoccus culcitae]UUX34010.1 YggT family protein [Fundicoccus culcitae]
MQGILSLLLRLLDLYQLVLAVYALLSWFPGGRQSKLGQIITKLSQPYIDIFDRYIPPIGGVSFNVIFAILGIQLVQRGLIMIFSIF